MTRLNGLTKAAKLASGRSQRCGTCISYKKRRCTLEITRICHDSFVEGFKKGAHFSIEKYNEAIKMFNEDYGTDLNKRLRKLLEETIELSQAIVGYNYGLNGIEAIKDEMSDVLAVLTHVSSLLGTDQRELLENALDKIIKRKKDPNYKRTHPHIGD